MSLTGWIADLAWDIRLAARAIRAMPGVAGVLVASLAVGIGVNTTVFSWIQSQVLQPLPGVERGSDFYLVEARSETGYPGLSWPEYRDLQERLSSFREVVAFRMAPLNVGAADWSERTYGLLVSGNYFSALGVRADTGRLFAPEDTATPGGPPIVVVSHRFWQARLAGAADVVGRTIRVNDRPFTIVGVVPASFVGTVMGLTFDVWTPATAAPVLLDGSRELENRAQRGYMALGDLKPGVSRADAVGDVNAVMRDLALVYPETNRTITGEVVPQWQSPRGPQQSIVAALAVLQAAMLLVLAVVAGNTTNLVLARASGRQRDAGTMLALGSGRWRIARLVMVENLLLSLTGAAIGAALAVWGTTALRSVPLPTPGGLEVAFHTRVDGVSLAFALVLGTLSAVVIGLPAGLQLGRVSPIAATRSAGVAAGRSTMRDIFLALEVAMAMVVLMVAAMFLKSFSDTRTIDPGFRQDGVLLATYDLRGRDGAVPPAASTEFAARLLDRLRPSASFTSVAVAASVPLDIHGMPTRQIRVEGRAREDGSADTVLTNTVTPGYFATMDIALVDGVDFADLRDAVAPPQAVVNETFVRRFVDGGSVLGRRIDSGDRTYTIVGVVRDSLYSAFGEDPAPFVYLSYRDRPSAVGEIHARVRGGDEKAVTGEIRAAVRALNADLPIYNVRTLTEHVDANLVFRRIPARMFVVLGPLLLMLVGVGISAVTAHAVALRRREIGTRIALGATAGRLLAMLLSDTLRVVTLGMAGGVVAVLMIVPGALSGQPGELALLAGVAVLFMGAAVVATWLPARRASRADPVAALKGD